MALLEEHDPAVLDRMAIEGIDHREAHAEVRRALGTGDDRMWEGILVTPRVRKIVALAEEQAGGSSVEPVDLYAAVRGEGGSRAAEILRRSAADRQITPQRPK